jgi:glycosyltransferase involved in cell wall biosynthesis
VHVQEQIHSFHETEAAVELTRLAKAPVVATFHEFHSELPSARHTIALAQRATILVANDTRTADRCRQFAGRPVDHLAWSPSNIDPPAESVPARHQLCVTFGFISAFKALGLVRDALELLRRSNPNLRWRVVGPFHPDRDSYHDELARSCAADWVEFTGAFADSRDPRLRRSLAEGAVMLLPFTDGATPRRGTLQAGWALGIPVVTTPPPVPEPEIVDGVNCLLVREASPTAWAESVGRLFADPTLADRLRAGGRVTAERFSWRRLADLHLTIYDTLLERSRARGEAGP